MLKESSRIRGISDWDKKIAVALGTCTKNLKVQLHKKLQKKPKHRTQWDLHPQYRCIVRDPVAGVCDDRSRSSLCTIMRPPRNHPKMVTYKAWENLGI